MPDVPIDWASVNWPYIVMLAVIVFFSTLIGTLLASRRVFPALALLFSAAFVFWAYYPRLTAADIGHPRYQSLQRLQLSLPRPRIRTPQSLRRLLSLRPNRNRLASLKDFMRAPPQYLSAMIDRLLVWF
jgi:hypothetical protein